MKEKTKSASALRILLVLSFIAITEITLTYCNKNSGTHQSEPASASANASAVATDDSVRTYADLMPVFTGGDTAILGYIARHAKYPADAKAIGKQGKVVVRLIVGKDGMVSNVSILKSVYPSLDAEALRVVGSLPKFEKPAIQDGKPVAIHYMMPINFDLK